MVRRLGGWSSGQVGRKVREWGMGNGNVGKGGRGLLLYCRFGVNVIAMFPSLGLTERYTR